MFSTIANTFFPKQRAITNETLGHPSVGKVYWFDPAAANSAGQVVTRDTALTVAAWWCGIRIIAETVATTPCILYRKTSDDSRERASGDPRYFLVHDEPHPEITACSFFETQTAYVVTDGNCYSRIVTDGMGMPSILEPRFPDNVCVEVDGNRLQYEIKDTQENISSDRMLHVKGLGPDGIKGWSAIKYGTSTIGGAMAANERANAQHANNAMPGGALKFPGKLDKPARENFRREWGEVHDGSKNAGKIAILHGGMDFTPYSMSNEDAQFLETRVQSVRDIARILRLPLHMLMDLEFSAVRANIEQSAIEFLVYSMAPWYTRWTQALNRKLLTREERGPMYFEFMLDSLLRGDIEMRYRAYAISRQWGWHNVNDIKRKENENTIGAEGDVYLQPSNMVPAGTMPDTIVNEQQRNLGASMAEILKTAHQLKTEMECGRGVDDAIKAATLETAQQMRGFREVGDMIRKDIAELGERVQVRGAGMTGALSNGHEAEALFRAKLACLVKIEKSEVVKAARKQATRGEPFIAWMEEWYASYPWEKQDVGSDKFRGDWVEDSKRQLLSACDGPAEGFVDRIQDTVKLFDLRVREAKE